MAKAKPLTPAATQQSILRALRVEASHLRAQAKSRRMSGPHLRPQRDALRAEAARCSEIAQLVLRCDAQKLGEVLGD